MRSAPSATPPAAERPSLAAAPEVKKARVAVAATQKATKAAKCSIIVAVYGTRAASSAGADTRRLAMATRFGTVEAPRIGPNL
ncbi:hypothetical protein ACIQAC_40355 [Streptomyces sp. NPDC088387]|uniref:hypothetical protein n=1 Tax=Streptomyces sp. NPDC088387 TaxID=3365859 RepID=UPI00380490CA